MDQGSTTSIARKASASLKLKAQTETYCCVYKCVLSSVIYIHIFSNYINNPKEEKLKHSNDVVQLRLGAISP